MKKIYFIAFMSLIPLIAFAQNANDQKLRFADSYEKSGDLKNASRIYLELYNSNPKSEVYFLGVVRTFKAQSQFTELLEIVQKRCETTQKPDLYALLGELLWRKGLTQDANNAWKKAIELAPKSEKTYSDIANAQISLRLYEKAISTYETARSELESKNIFAENLCQLFVATGNVERGTNEIFAVFEQNRNLPNAQGRLSALMANAEAKKKMYQILSSKIGASSDNILYLKLYGWFLRSINELEKAFDVYKQIDALSKGDGREIFLFASDSQKDGQYDIAIKAYEALIDKGNACQYFMNALYGLPRTLEQKMQMNSELTKENAESIIKRYRSIISRFPEQTMSSDSYYRIAVIYRENLRNNEQAEEELNILVKKFPYMIASADAYLLLGEIYLENEKFDLAAQMYKEVINKFRKVHPVNSDRALYKLAELEYFDGNIDSAKAHFSELSSNSSSDVAGDALNKIFLIEQNKTLTKAIPVYAKAEMKLAQKKYIDAINLFKETISYSEKTDLGDRSHIKIAEIELTTGNYISAREWTANLQRNNPNSLYLDYALMITANSYLSEKNFEAATKAFTELITQFPRSIYIQEAREKIKRIRAKEKI